MKVEPLFSEDEIRARVKEMAQEISQDFSDKMGADEAPPITLVLANGAIFFAADLLRRLDFQVDVQVVRVSSYGSGTLSNGAPKILGGFPADKFSGRRVIIIDDVFDTGHTLAKIRLAAEVHGAKEVRTCVLLDKQARRVVPGKADYVGFRIDDVFVVGYGLDLNDEWRTLPYVGKIDTEGV